MSAICAVRSWNRIMRIGHRSVMTLLQVATCCQAEPCQACGSQDVRWLKAAVLHACPSDAADAPNSDCAAGGHILKGTCCKQLMRIADNSSRHDAAVQLLA